MKRTKCWISVLLVLCLCVSLLPVRAAAQNADHANALRCSNLTPALREPGLVKPNEDRIDLGMTRGEISLGYARQSAAVTDQAEPEPRLRWWMSDTEFGDSIGDFLEGNSYYFCYEIYDAVSGSPWDEVADSTYTVRQAVYGPDGSELYSAEIDEDSGWIRVFCPVAGTYIREIILSGNLEFSGSREFEVHEDNIWIYATENEVILKPGETTEIYVWTEGYHDTDTLLSWEVENGNVSCKWGDWTEEGRATLHLTGKSEGTDLITLCVLEEGTETILDSWYVGVTVASQTYTISYDANGGEYAPADQTKAQGVELYLAEEIPERLGYNFLGWATSRGATAAGYLPGGSFTLDANTTLYAVWESAGTISSNVTSSTYHAPIPFDYSYRDYVFTPSFTGMVQFQSTGQNDTRIYLFDENGDNYGYDDDGGEEYNFLLTQEVNAGNRYYVRVEYYSGGTGTIDFTVKRGYDIDYDANGGIDAPDPQLKIHGVALTLTTDEPTRSDYSFLGWSTNRSASSASYQPGGSFTSNGNTTLYAVWRSNTIHEHSYSYSVSSTPTTSASGALRGVCAGCGDTTTVTLPKLNTTDYTRVITREPTCNAGGTARYTWKTTTYGTFYFDVSLPSGDHTYAAVVTEPTCFEPGYTTYTCTGCGRSYVDDEVPARGHVYQSVVIAPTCTEMGFTLHTCTGCGDSYRSDHVNPTGHNFEVVVTPPTCTEQGYTSYICRCGERHVDAYTPALGHDWNGDRCRRCGAAGNPFTDVPQGSFYLEPVLWAVEKGITTGATATTFNPNGICVRAQVVTFLWRAAGCPEPQESRNPFVDVKKTDFYYKAVLWAVEKGITTGTDATHFSPMGTSNRAQVVTFLWRAFDKPEPAASTHPFRDVPKGSFYEKPVLWAVEEGITSGMSATSFGPNQSCNRAQIVTFLYRAYTDL